VGNVLTKDTFTVVSYADLIFIYLFSHDSTTNTNISIAFMAHRIKYYKIKILRGHRI